VVINQGDIFWIELGKPSGSAPGYRHPHVVIQNNVFNRSRINTVIVCAITSNLKRASAPGNVSLTKNETNLPKKSVVNISQIVTVDKNDLLEKIGTLNPRRL
jgi:mRNA interferase MazF